MGTKINNAKLVCQVTVIDPDSKGEVQMEVYKHEGSGGMFAIDSSYIEQCCDEDSYPVVPDVFSANGGFEKAQFVMLQD
jgi:hypothetical protein